jgi:Flp pilus assembly protein TadD
MYALTGRKEEAIREARRAVEMVGDDRYSAPSYEENLAYVLALNGELETSQEITDRLLSTAYHDSLTIQMLRWLPWPGLDALRDDPRHKEFLRKHE